MEAGVSHLEDGSAVYSTPQLRHKIIVAANPPSSFAADDHGRAISGTSLLSDGSSVYSPRGSIAEEHRPLSMVTKACYSVGHSLNDLCSAVWFSYLLLYLQDGQKLSPSQAGIVLFSGQLADALATPTVGILSDCTPARGLSCCGPLNRFFTLGRRKLWNFIGVLVVMVAFFFVFGECILCAIGKGEDGPDGGAWNRTIAFAVFASLFNVGWAAVQVSHMTLVPELSTDDHERVWLNSARFAFTVISSIYVYLTMFALLRLVPDDQQKADPTRVYTLLTYFVLGAGGLMSLIFLIGTKEKLADPHSHQHGDYQRLGASEPNSRQVSVVAAAATSSCSSAEHSSSPYQSLHEGPSSGTTTAATVTSKVRRAHSADSVAIVSLQAPSSSTDQPSGGVPSSLSSLVPDGISLTTSGTHKTAAGAAEGDVTAAVKSKRNSSRRKEKGDSAGGGGGGPKEDSNGRLQLRHEDALGGHNRPRIMKWKDFLKLPTFYQVSAVYMCVRLATNLSTVYLSFFVTQTLKMTQTAIAIVPLLVYLSQLAATLSLQGLSKRLGRRNTMTLGALVFAASCLAMVFIQPGPTSAILYPSVLLLGVGSAITLVVSVSLEADLVGRNTEAAAFVYGAISFTDKLSSGGGVLLIQFLGQGGDMGNGDVDPSDGGGSVTPARATFVRYVNSLVPLAAMLAGLLICWTIKFPKHLQAQKPQQNNNNKGGNESINGSASVAPEKNSGEEGGVGAGEDVHLLAVNNDDDAAAQGKRSLFARLRSFMRSDIDLNRAAQQEEEEQATAAATAKRMAGDDDASDGKHRSLLA